MKLAIFNGRSLAARFSLLAACALTLAACQTDGSGPTAAEAPRTGTAAAWPDAQTPLVQASRPAETPQNVEPMTRTRAARECWMRTEKGSARENLDKRADIVNKCIDEKMKSAATHSPKS
jgi:hypothetical protein